MKKKVYLRIGKHKINVTKEYLNNQLKSNIFMMCLDWKGKDEFGTSHIFTGQYKEEHISGDKTEMFICGDFSAELPKRKEIKENGE